MSTRTKVITTVLLAALAIALAYFVWVQTKLILISLALLAATVAVLYFIFRKA